MQAPASSDLHVVVQISESIPKIDMACLEIEDTSSLGRGAFSEVYAGHWGTIPVAIKKLSTHAALEKEARIHYPLKHKHIVSMYGILSQPEHNFIIMARLSKSLQDLLHSDVALSLVEIYTIAYGIMKGVAYLHAHSVIHRDLKTANVLLNASPPYHPYLSDFGLSEREEEKAQQIYVQPSGERQIWGSPAWIAPELFRNWPCSQRSDIYSIGVLLWEMITRRLPFATICRQEIIRKGMRGEREAIPPSVPKNYTQLIKKCWKQKPQNRPENVTYVARYLKLFKAHVIEDRLGCHDKQVRPNSI